METRASYLVVGGFVLTLFAGLLVFVVWFAKFQFDREFVHYDVYFQGRVTGLSVGSTVSYRGIPVGEVIALDIDPDNVEQVLVTIEVPTDTPIKSDTVASLELAAITGGAMILLSGGTQEAPKIVVAEGRERALIPSQPSRLEQFLQGAPELVENFRFLVGRAVNLLNEDNQAAFAETLQNLSYFSGALANRGADIETLINDAAGMMGNLRDASVALEELARKLGADADGLTARADSAIGAIDDAARSIEAAVGGPDGDVQLLIADVRGSAQSVQAMADEIEGVVAENREAFRDFSTACLYELTGLVAEIRSLVTGLNRVTTEVQRDPARFLFGNQQQGYEAPR